MNILKKGKIIIIFITVSILFFELVGFSKTENNNILSFDKIWFGLTIFSLYFMYKGKMKWRFILIFKLSISIIVFIILSFLEIYSPIFKFLPIKTSDIFLTKEYLVNSLPYFIILIVFLLFYILNLIFLLFSKSLLEYIKSKKLSGDNEIE